MSSYFKKFFEKFKSNHKASSHAEKTIKKERIHDDEYKSGYNLYNDLCFVNNEGGTLNNCKIAYDNKDIHSSEGVLNIEVLYPYATEQYQVMDNLKTFKEDLSKFLLDDEKVTIEAKYTEIARIHEVLQYRSTITHGFIKDDIQALSNKFYYDMFLKYLHKDNYATSVAAANCLRNNIHTYKVASALIAIVEDESLPEQTRMEFADNLERNCYVYGSIQERATAYIDSVIGEIRGTLRNAIKGRHSFNPRWHRSEEKCLIIPDVPEKLEEEPIEDLLYDHSEGEDHELVLMQTLPSMSSQEKEGESVEGQQQDHHIYESSQNVHKTKISSIINAKLTKLYQDPFDDTEFFFLTRNEFMKEVEQSGLVKTTEQMKGIERGLGRIAADPTTFEPVNITLKEVFQRVWGRMKASQHKPELLRRIIEELIDTAEFCASGYLSRLINVLSGFEDVELRENDQDMMFTNETEQEIKAKLTKLLQDDVTFLDEFTQEAVILGLGEAEGEYRNLAENFIREKYTSWLEVVRTQYVQPDHPQYNLALEQFEHIFARACLKLLRV